MNKINIHSIVDVITNSSTVIYTYQNSTKQAKELIGEILKLSGEKRDVDDLFYFGEFLDDTSVYLERLDESQYTEKEKNASFPDVYSHNTNYKEANKWMENIIDQILRGKIKKPKWMGKIEDDDGYSGSDEYSPDISLYILPREDKHKPLVKKIMNFLNSPSHESCYDG